MTARNGDGLPSASVFIAPGVGYSRGTTEQPSHDIKWQGRIRKELPITYLLPQWSCLRVSEQVGKLGIINSSYELIQQLESNSPSSFGYSFTITHK
jgi:hypothetical protein